MASTPRFVRPLMIFLSIANFGGLIWALRAGEPMHAAGHVMAGVALMFWSRRLREQARDERGDVLESGERDAQIEGLEHEMDQLRRELAEAQERLDFTERVLAQRPTQKT